MTREKLMNVEEFQRVMGETGFDAVVATSQPNVFYTSGALIMTQLAIPKRLAMTVLPKGGDDALLVCNIEESLARADSWIEDVRSYVEYAQTPIALLADVLKDKGLAAGRIGIDKMYLPVAHYEELAEALPRASLEACDELFDEVRSIKTEGEIERFAQAALATERAIVEAFREAKVGSTEAGVLRSITEKVGRAGASHTLFGVLRAGDQSFHAHPAARERELEPGDLVGVDFGAVFDGYGSDVARMAIVGDASDLQAEMYDKHRRVQRKAVECMRAGVRASEVYEVCVQAYADFGIELPGPHVGHGFGLSLHEAPMLQPQNSQELRSNMLIYIEPVIVDERVGALQLEDLILVKEDGAEIITTYADTEELFVIQ